jgi:hypothetical protein
MLSLEHSTVLFTNITADIRRDYPFMALRSG